MSRIVTNRKGSNATILFTANASYIVVGNNSVSNIATAGETVKSATITQAIFSSNGGYWEIKRGANTVMQLAGTHQINFSASGLSMSLDSTAPLSANLVGGTAGFLVLEINKNSDVSNSQYLVG